jgi:predicted P-loop ATPase
MNGDERHEVRQHFAEHGIPVDFGENITPRVKSNAPLGGAADVFKLLILTKDETPRAILANALLMLRCHPSWFGVLAYNQFSLHTVTKKPAPWQHSGGMNWTDNDDSLTAEWLQHAGVLVNSKVAAEAAQTVARENPFHPVQDYLHGLEWDGKARVDQWLTTYLGAEESLFTRAIGVRWLISAVARIFHPGCQADHVLLLEGPQGIRKSSALRALTGDPWFADHIADLGSKDSRLDLHGKWIIEMSELVSMRRGEIERVKAFLTAPTDHFRLPYERRAADVPRQNVFAASTNEEQPFVDSSGNRRFWPVHCGQIDVDGIRRGRDQLWAEAYNSFKQGRVWWLETAELNRLAQAEQEERYEEGVWDSMILDWVEEPHRREEGDGSNTLPMTPWDGSEPGKVTITDVLVHAIGKPADRLTQADRNQVARCLSHHGWRREQERGGPGRGKRFYVRSKR